MPARPICRALLALVVATAPVGAVFAPRAAARQVRDVLTKEVSVGRSSAVLRLEFVDGTRLEIAFDDGSVSVDGRSVGSFEPGGELDAAWRTLLAQAVALDGGSLAEALAAWTAPADLAGPAGDAARRVDRALEDAVRSVGASTVESPARAASVYVHDDVTVTADEVVEGDLVVIGGYARVAGRVQGDVVVVDGTLELLEGGSVSGTVRLADATLASNRGTVGEGVVTLAGNPGVDQAVRDELRAEVRDELRDEMRDEMRRELRIEGRNRDRGPSAWWSSPFRPIIRGVGGVLQNIVAIIVLALIGAAVIAFGGDKVDVIAETVRRSPGRSAAAGMAATVLLIPIWVVGFVALVITIVGIPVAIAWLPLFPLAVAVSALVGYLAVARNAGEWLADSDYPWTHWIRRSNSLVTTVGGLVGLFALFVAANVVSMAPFLGWVTGLLIAAGCIVTAAAMEIGLGAVILTRAGRRREPWSRYAPGEAWEAAMHGDDQGSDA